jgi:hypothetical protein
MFFRQKEDGCEDVVGKAETDSLQRVGVIPRRLQSKADGRAYDNGDDEPVEPWVSDESRAEHSNAVLRPKY